MNLAEAGPILLSSEETVSTSEFDLPIAMIGVFVGALIVVSWYAIDG